MKFQAASLVHLPSPARSPTLKSMMEHYHHWRKNSTVRLCLFVVGVLLIIAAPLVGIIPGPGGIVVFALGLALVLQNSRWAKKRYVAFKRRWPKHGEWADWGLRRESYKRRSEVAKQQQDGG